MKTSLIGKEEARSWHYCKIQGKKLFKAVDLLCSSELGSYDETGQVTLHGL